MGFSLYLYKIDGDRLVDPDRDGVQEFLRRRRMHMKVFPPSSADRSSFATLLNEDGTDINVDGLQDFHFSNVLEEDEAVTAGTGHAYLTAGECDFIFDLCVSAGFMIVNPQGGPSYIVPRGNHTAENLRAITQGMSEEDQRQDIVAVDSGEELQALLTGRFQSFLDWREQAFTRLELNGSGPEPSPSSSLTPALKPPPRPLLAVSEARAGIEAGRSTVFSCSTPFVTHSADRRRPAARRRF